MAHLSKPAAYAIFAGVLVSYTIQVRPRSHAYAVTLADFLRLRLSVTNCFHILGVLSASSQPTSIV